MKRSFLRRWSQRLLALLIGIVLSALLGEGLLRLLAPQNLSGSWRIPSQTRGYVMNKAGGTARHALGDRVVHYRFNSHHLRGPEIGEGRTRILCLGDSVTFGWRLKEEHTYLELLEARAAQEFGAGEFEFLNGGVGGWGTAHYLAFLEEFGEEIDPQVVLVCFGGDDIGRSLRQRLYVVEDRLSLALREESLPESRLKKTLNAIPGYQWLLEHSHLVQFLRHAAVAAVTARKMDGAAPAAVDPAVADPELDEVETDEPGAGPDDPAVLLGQALFKRLARWCREREVDLWVMTTGFERTHGLDAPGKPTGRFLQTAERFFLMEGIPYRNQFAAVMDRMGEHRDEHYIPLDGHPNEKGAAVIAECAWPWIYERLREHWKGGR